MLLENLLNESNTIIPYYNSENCIYECHYDNLISYNEIIEIQIELDKSMRLNESYSIVLNENVFINFFKKIKDWILKTIKRLIDMVKSMFKTKSKSVKSDKKTEPNVKPSKQTNEKVETPTKTEMIKPVLNFKCHDWATDINTICIKKLPIVSYTSVIGYISDVFYKCSDSNINYIYNENSISDKFDSEIKYFQPDYINSLFFKDGVEKMVTYNNQMELSYIFAKGVKCKNVGDYNITVLQDIKIKCTNLINDISDFVKPVDDNFILKTKEEIRCRIMGISTQEDNITDINGMIETRLNKQIKSQKKTNNVARLCCQLLSKFINILSDDITIIMKNITLYNQEYEEYMNTINEYEKAIDEYNKSNYSFYTV